MSHIFGLGCEYRRTLRTIRKRPPVLQDVTIYMLAARVCKGYRRNIRGLGCLIFRQRPERFKWEQNGPTALFAVEYVLKLHVLAPRLSAILFRSQKLSKTPYVIC